MSCENLHELKALEVFSVINFALSQISRVILLETKLKRNLSDLHKDVLSNIQFKSLLVAEAR